MTDGKLMIQAGLAVWHVLYLSLGVTERSVLAASKRYARQLTFSCETLILDRKV